MRTLSFLLTFLLASSSFANNPGVSYQGRIFKPDGTPLEGTAVQFRMQVRSPGSENCLLYEEVQTLNMAGSAGVFSLTMNDGTGTRLDSPTYQVDRIFANRGTMTLDTTRCATGTDYIPNSSDGRKLVVYFKDETMAAYEAMPIMNLNYVPQSMYALESQKVGTFAVNNILRAVDGSGNPVTAPALDPTQLTNLTNLLAGTSTQYATAAQFSTIQTFATTAPPTCGPGEVLKSNGTALSCVTDSAGGAPAYSAITAASATNTIDNANFAQTWNWSTATTQSPMSMSANALTTGSAMNVTTSSASLNSTNGLLNVANTGASTNGILARFQSNSTAGSGLTVLTNGNVGIGTTSPTTSLLVSKDQAGDTQIAVENRNTTASTGSTSISFRGYRDVETDYELAKIRMQPSASGMGGNLAHNGSLIFYTGGYDAGGGGGWAKPRMKIDWAGNVGINTTTPQAFLDIAVPSSDTTNSASIILSTHASTYASPALYLLGTRPNFTSKYGDTGVEGWKLSSTSGSGGTGGMEDDATFCFRNGTAAENCLMHFDGSSRNINIGGVNSSLHAGSRLNVMGNMTVGGTWSTYSTQKAAPANSLIVEGMIGAATDIPTSALDINGALTQRGMAAPALSPTGQGRIYFDSSSNTFKVSQNGSGYVDLFGAGGGNILNNGNTAGAAITIGTNDAFDLHFETGGTTKMTATSTGTVGVGTTSPEAKLDVVDTGTTTSAIIVPRAGNFTGTEVNGMIRYNTTSTLFEFRQNGTWVNYTTVSDGRLKTNVVPVVNGLDIVNQLNPVFYDWDRNNPKASSFTDKHQVGFIAQEVETVLPEVVNRGEDSYRSVEYGQIVSVAVAAIKELYARVIKQDEKNETQDRELASLKSENADLKARLEQQEKELADIKKLFPLESKKQ